MSGEYDRSGSWADTNVQMSNPRVLYGAVSYQPRPGPTAQALASFIENGTGVVRTATITLTHRPAAAFETRNATLYCRDGSLPVVGGRTDMTDGNINTGSVFLRFGNFVITGVLLPSAAISPDNNPEGTADWADTPLSLGEVEE